MPSLDGHIDVADFPGGAGGTERAKNDMCRNP
jgi:hypothetical protein